MTEIPFSAALSAMGERAGFYHACPDAECHCFDLLAREYTWSRIANVPEHMLEGPVEDQLDDPNHQDPSSDLPDPVEGNDDEDDMPDVPAEGE